MQYDPKRIAEGSKLCAQQHNTQRGKEDSFAIMFLFHGTGKFVSSVLPAKTKLLSGSQTTSPEPCFGKRPDRLIFRIGSSVH